ncbi:hypothetical protein ABZ456_29265 [Streptomyces sp. NPDC005776]|uniref:hypothetical protein n=1 Tax=Streptomyces sp. NPDC005776 TaxID=3154676 RepID=UPI00340CA9D3
MSARADLMRLLTAFTSIDRARRLVDLHHAEVLATADPIVVSRFDVAMEPAPEDEQVLTVGCIAADGRPVALVLDPETRARVAGWLSPMRIELSDNDRVLLAFALELAADQMANRGDEFDDEDTASLAALNRVATEAPRG